MPFCSSLVCAPALTFEEGREPPLVGGGTAARRSRPASSSRSRPLPCNLQQTITGHAGSRSLCTTVPVPCATNLEYAKREWVCRENHRSEYIDSSERSPTTSGQYGSGAATADLLDSQGGPWSSRGSRGGGDSHSELTKPAAGWRWNKGGSLRAGLSFLETFALPDSLYLLRLISENL